MQLAHVLCLLLGPLGDLPKLLTGLLDLAPRLRQRGHGALVGVDVHAAHLALSLARHALYTVGLHAGRQERVPAPQHVLVVLAPRLLYRSVHRVLDGKPPLALRHGHDLQVHVRSALVHVDDGLGNGEVLAEVRHPQDVQPISVDRRARVGVWVGVLVAELHHELVGGMELLVLGHMGEVVPNLSLWMALLCLLGVIRLQSVSEGFGVHVRQLSAHQGDVFGHPRAVDVGRSALQGRIALSGVVLRGHLAPAD